MKLTELFANVPDIEINSLMADSRRKRPQSIFFCIKGMKFDGHKFVDQAIANGAVVVVHQEALEKLDAKVTYIKVKDVNATYNKVADVFYDYPSHHLNMFAVTGTNGKTIVAFIIRDILNKFEPTGYIGQMAIQYGGVKLTPTLTTPDVDELHGVLKDMREAGMKSCVLETSSIVIEQHRVDTVDFDFAVFTNLDREHLDYHGTMANYLQAKKALFDHLKPEAYAITNVDDPNGLKVVEDTKARIITYGIETSADFQIVNYKLGKDRTVMTLKVRNREYELKTNLVARFNIYNLLAAIAVLNARGIAVTDMLPHLENLSRIEGRMELIKEGQPFNVLIDIARTPESIEKVCRYARAITPRNNRIIGVAGCPGQRNSAKRKLIGEILDKYCDMIILSETDAGSEKVQAIADDMALGIRENNYIIVENRVEAIREALELAYRDDTVLLLGKGDEKFLERSYGRENYEGDEAIVREFLKE